MNAPYRASPSDGSGIARNTAVRSPEPVDLRWQAPGIVGEQVEFGSSSAAFGVRCSACLRALASGRRVGHVDDVTPATVRDRALGRVRAALAP